MVSHYLGTRLGAGLGPNSLVPVFLGSLARTRCTFYGEHCSNPDVPVVEGGVAGLGADRWPGAVIGRYRGAWLGPWRIEKEQSELWMISLRSLARPYTYFSNQNFVLIIGSWARTLDSRKKHKTAENSKGSLARTCYSETATYSLNIRRGARLGPN
jgi:hypothetical protein